MAKMTGGQAIVRTLMRHGVDTVFGLPGVQPITRLSNIQPFQYTFALDIGRTWEGTPSTLLQECNSITSRNQPLSCQQQEAKNVASARSTSGSRRRNLAVMM